MATNQRKNIVLPPDDLRTALTAAVRIDGELPTAKRLGVARLTLARMAAGFLCDGRTVAAVAAEMARRGS